MVLSAGMVIVLIGALFPAGRLFPIAFASLIAVYAAIFSLFVEEVFLGIDVAFLVVGFCLPIFFFVLVAGFAGIRSEPSLPIRRYVVSRGS
jgi:hypothetical protein